MLSKKIEEALNDQINAEFWSAYFYLSMSVFFAADGKPGFANWYKVQYQEEQDHALKLIQYVIERGNKVELKPVDKVPCCWSSPLVAFEDTLTHEKEVTSRIKNLVTLARSEQDYATENMLTWFMNEQVEEEANVNNYIGALKMINNDSFGIYSIDKELGQRTYAPITMPGK